MPVSNTLSLSLSLALSLALALSLSLARARALSLSLSHTHTHIHTHSLSFSFACDNERACSDAELVVHGMQKCQKRPNVEAKETQYRCNRDLL